MLAHGKSRLPIYCESFLGNKLQVQALVMKEGVNEMLEPLWVQV